MSKHPPGGAERRPLGKGGASSQQHIQMDCSTPLVCPAHLRRYADILRCYSLAVTNGLARTAAVASPDSEAASAYVAIEAWKLMADVEAIRACVHELATWLEGGAA